MKNSTKLMLKILYVLSWIIFIGLCIEAGSFLTNAIFALANPGAIKYLWQQVDLTNLVKYDHGHFFVVTFIMSIVTVLKAWMFYLIIKIAHDKKVNMVQPFNKEVGRFAFNVSYITLLIGLFSWCGINYAEWLVRQGVKMPDAQQLHLDGADVWLFMSVTLFVVAQIFKKGIEIQTENDLTI